MERIRAQYWLESAYPIEKAVEVLAGEQSCGTFVAVPGETLELREKHAARVESIELLDECPSPSLPGATKPAGDSASMYRRAQIEVSWPLANVGVNLPNLMATVAGNLFELSQFSGLRLLDIEVPESYFDRYAGTPFGVEGTRRFAEVYDRPIIGTIIKPSVGLTPKQTAEQTKTLIEAGLDFLKDDELMGDSPHSPFESRVDAVMEVINREADKTGKKAMYAFNVSGDLDDMIGRHDYVLGKGGTCVMVSLNWIGLSALAKLRDHCQLPIHGHRNGWGLFSRSPHIGIDFKAFQKVWRLAGVDQLHTNGIRNKFCEGDDSVLASILACQTSFGGSCAMPVLSSGQWAGQAVDTYEAIGNTDLMYVCGGGIVAHPSGIAAGVASVRQAWEAAVSGTSLEAYAKEHRELAEALVFFGERTAK